MKTLTTDVRALIHWFRTSPRPPEIDALIDRVSSQMWWLERLSKLFSEDVS